MAPPARSVCRWCFLLPHLHRCKCEGCPEAGPAPAPGSVQISVAVFVRSEKRSIEPQPSGSMADVYIKHGPPRGDDRSNSSRGDKSARQGSRWPTTAHGPTLKGEEAPQTLDGKGESMQLTHAQDLGGVLYAQAVFTDAEGRLVMQLAHASCYAWPASKCTHQHRVAASAWAASSLCRILGLQNAKPGPTSELTAGGSVCSLPLSNSLSPWLNQSCHDSMALDLLLSPDNMQAT